MNRQHQLYERIGHLFYAVTCAERKLNDEEVKRLKYVIRRQWLPLEDTDEFCVDAAQNIFFAFDSVQSQQAESAYAYEKFAQYYCDNREDFNSLLRERILKTTQALSSLHVTSPALVDELKCLIQN